MTIIEYISSQHEDRQKIMDLLHQLIIANDKTVIPIVENMMGKPMIIYKDKGVMKYGLSGVKKHMSLHCLPIYVIPDLHAKYANLLPSAKLQKGCINFTNAEAVPEEIIANLISDCARINIADMLANRKKGR